MIATAGRHSHHELQSGLIAIALDTTDAATNSNSLLPVMPWLGIYGQCSGSLPATAADDDDGWLYSRTPNLQAPPQSSICWLLSEEMCCACVL